MLNEEIAAAIRRGSFCAMTTAATNKLSRDSAKMLAQSLRDKGFRVAYELVTQDVFNRFWNYKISWTPARTAEATAEATAD